MRWLLILLVIIAVIAILWYLQQQSVRAAERRARDERQLQGPATRGDQAPTDTPAIPVAASATARSTRPGLLQGAADLAAGRRYERATSELEGMTAELAQARQDADRAAARLAGRVDETLAAVQAAAATQGGAVPGDGTEQCPPGYPIKGNLPARQYHQPDQPAYVGTVPEVCFQSVAAAEAAGFAPAQT